MGVKGDRKADEERQALQDHLGIAPDVGKIAGEPVKPYAVAPIELALATPLDERLDRLRHDR